MLSEYETTLNVYTNQLRNDIARLFDMTEIKGLCANLGIDYDELDGATISLKISELIKYCQRHNLLPKLANQLLNLRSFHEWPDLPRKPLPGWVWITKQYLNEVQKQTLSREQVISYFNGRDPQWEIAINDSSIPRRQIVNQLIQVLQKNRDANQPGVTVLIGPGGEGKSTALRQVICDMVLHSGWDIFWRDTRTSGISAKFILDQAKSTNNPLLIASDDADSLANDIFQATKFLLKEGANNVQFLLCARETDWVNANADQLRWPVGIRYHEEPLSGLDKDDAYRIISAWEMYGQDGMGNLNGLSQAEAVEQLIQAASDQDIEDGSFLGAMLQVRKGATIKEHVKTLLNRLQEISAPGGNLLKAFAYIAVPHAYNIKELFEDMLREVLRCNLRELEVEIVYPLKGEAMVATYGPFILTRHRKIAETVLEIISSPPYLREMDIEKIIVQLVLSAAILDASKDTVLFLAQPQKVLQRWTNLATTFAKNNDKQSQKIAIRIASTLSNKFPNNPVYLTNYAKLLRDLDQADRAVFLFRNSIDQVKRDRAFYYEWSNNEGHTNHHDLSVWLASISISDQIPGEKCDNTRAKISLDGLSIAFRELHMRFNDPIYLEACSAAASLGLRVPNIDKNTRDNLIHKIKYCQNKGYHPVELSISNALETIKKGVLNAVSQNRSTGLPSWVPSPQGISFRNLEDLLTKARHYQRSD